MHDVRLIRVHVAPKSRYDTWRECLRPFLFDAYVARTNTA